MISFRYEASLIDLIDSIVFNTYRFLLRNSNLDSKLLDLLLY